MCVKDIKGKTTRIENSHAEFFYPHMFMKHTSINIEDVIAWQKAEIEKGRDGTNIPQRFLIKFFGLWSFDKDFSTGKEPAGNIYMQFKKNRRYIAGKNMFKSIFGWNRSICGM